MIVASRFAGDENYPLHGVQADYYWSRERDDLYFACSDRYLDAARFLSTSTPLSSLIEDRNSYDHRVLQCAYHAIAASYRFSVGPRAEKTLFETEDEYLQRLKDDWVAYFTSEIERLVKDNEVCLAVLTAVAYQNTPEGRASKERLTTLLRQKYSELPEYAFSLWGHGLID